MEYRETRPGNLYEDEIFIRKCRAREVHQLTVLHVHVWMWALMERNRRLGVEVGTALLEAGSTVPRPTTICGRIGGQDTGIASIGPPYTQNEVRQYLRARRTRDLQYYTPWMPHFLRRHHRPCRPQWNCAVTLFRNREWQLALSDSDVRACAGRKEAASPLSHVGQIFTYLHPRRDQYPQRTQQRVSARKPDPRAPVSALTRARTSKST